jgi:hypothetical protein
MPSRQGHVHITSPQVKAMIESRAQDKGRKRHIAVDVIGLLLTVLSSSADRSWHSVSRRHQQARPVDLVARRRSREPTA